MPVYFIQGGGLTKVGYASSPEGRLRGLQTGSPVSLRLVRVLDGTDRHEKDLHLQFARHHSHGEWFRLTDEQVFADHFGLKDLPVAETLAVPRLRRKHTGISVPSNVSNTTGAA
jgi:hypothetical protein